MTEQEINDESYKLVGLLYNKYKADDASQVTRLFILHNLIWPNIPEHGRSCGSCVNRVMTRMKGYYDTVLKPLYENK